VKRFIEDAEPVIFHNNHGGRMEATLRRWEVRKVGINADFIACLRAMNDWDFPRLAYYIYIWDELLYTLAVGKRCSRCRPARSLT
jgi:hypothetical protein